MSIMGNMIGSYSQIGRTFVLTDENGTELIGVCTEKEVIFDATAADIKIGKTAATDSGITEGTDTKTYRTTHAWWLVFPGESFSIPLQEFDKYNYTAFQAMIAEFNTTQFDSVFVDKISLNDAVYNVCSTEKLADTTKNLLSKSIDLNVVNNTDNVYIIHYNTYKEETN